ncbi:MAG: glutamine-scyllo-inositol transaminase [uncultured bacterium]|nr:MAG: glutamine-scyllo-inositol transaminase [uncultured bacterium]
MDAIQALAQKYNLMVIADGAHALGSNHGGQPICKQANITTLSFHPVKHITTGEGGAILTDDEELYTKMKAFRTHGIVNDRIHMQQDDGPWYFEMQHLGFNYRISDIQCALGISQLQKIDTFLQKRQHIAKYYIERLKDIPRLILPAVTASAISSWHLFVIRVDAEMRNGMFEAMRAAGIGVQVHYIPVYHHPYYRNNGFKDTSLQNTEVYYETCMSLPIYPALTREQQDYVINTLCSLFV